MRPRYGNYRCRRKGPALPLEPFQLRFPFDAIKIGADIALFYSESENEISFSARCRPTLDAEMNMHLGRIMRAISGTIEGTGGGHPCAAGAYGPKKEGRDAFVKAFRDRVFGERK